MMDLKSEIKEVMEYIEDIDFLDLTKRKENQRKINKAYLKLEAILKEIEGEIVYEYRRSNKNNYNE